jgi:hypothetical protein
MKKLYREPYIDAFCQAWFHFAQLFQRSRFLKYEKLTDVRRTPSDGKLKNYKTNLVAIYRPESYTTSSFLEQLQQLLQALTQDDSSTNVLGDFNEDILKSNSSIKTFMQKMDLHNL